MLVALAVTGVFTSCSPDDYSLASPAIIPAELVEGISYTVTPDPNNPNILVCKSDLGAGRNVAWQTPLVSPKVIMSHCKSRFQENMK